jgi:hypothetical protein
MDARAEQVGISVWRNETTATFWNWAEAERDEAPGAVVPLIDRAERRIVVSYEEAARIHQWALGLPGWAPLPADGKPLRFSNRDTNEVIPGFE